MTKTNYLSNISVVNFGISPETDSFLTSIHCNEIELLNMAGGIPEPGTNEILHTAEYAANTNSVVFSSESELFFAERELFWSDKFIDNKFLTVFAAGRGIGTYIFFNEIIQARKLGIVCLKVSAAKSDRLNGYYTWARLGYSIDSPEDLEDFVQLMGDHGRNEKSMIELMSTKEGREFWKKNGFWWQGVFDLSPGSENIKAFNNYVKEAAIDISL
jgi:hypothetical protein